MSEQQGLFNKCSMLDNCSIKNIALVELETNVQGDGVKENQAKWIFN
jgi:hypothetical protein